MNKNILEIDSCQDISFSPEYGNTMQLETSQEKINNYDPCVSNSNDFKDMLCSFICHHKLTNECIDDLLELLKHSTDLDRANIPSSRHTLFDITGLKKTYHLFFIVIV